MYGAYYIVCIEGYEIDGIFFHTGQVEWKSKECRPIQNPAWQKATEQEIQKHLNKSGYTDMRKI